MAVSPYVARLRARVGRERLVLPSVTGIVYDRSGAILLARHREGNRWSTPGGTVEPDESPAEAVVREVREETGLAVRPVRLLGVFGGPAFVVRYPNGDESQYVMSVFECAVEGGTPEPDHDETVELRWVGAAEFETLVVSSWAREVLPRLFSRPVAPLF
jgi:8-oxo-dGTP pyrophosphatase MutT (NUDIX family)